MPIGIAEGIGLGSQLFGAVTGKKKGKGNETSREIQELLKMMAQRAGAFDPLESSKGAAEEAQRLAGESMERAIGEVMARYGSQGSRSYLPDTARNSAVRGATSDVGERLATWLADRQAGAPMEWMRMASIPVGLAQAGRGENLQSNSQFNPANFGQSLAAMFGKKQSGAGQAIYPYNYQENYG